MSRQRTAALVMAAAIGLTGVIGTALAAPAAAAPSSDAAAAALQCAVFQIDAPGGFAINIRSGPGTQYRDIGDLRHGQRYLFRNRVQNNFRELNTPGQWAGNDHLIQVGNFGQCPV
ncbi:MAG: hypothetical protein ACT4NY_28240 [Pseudonocardiales bacterium]